VIVAFVVLAIIWAAVLIPPMVRQRAEIRPADSIGDFRRRLGILQRTSPVAIEPAFRLQNSGVTESMNTTIARARRRESQRRRRDILVWLSVTAVATLFLGLLPAFRVMLWANLITDILLFAYISLLIQMKKRNEEREEKLRYLPTAQITSPHPSEQYEETVFSSMPDDGNVTVIAESQ
jgi:hypothetical protein